LRVLSKRMRGFTLIEVLVALAIVAVALGAGISSMSALTRNTERQQLVMLAQLCADNSLVALRLSKQMPSVGSSTQNCEQAGRAFEVQSQVSPTPNPSFRRMDVRVSFERQSVLSVSTVVGRY
jgi:general secretion pathway protein I